ncbi:WD40 repeat-like protein [Lentithecium fluviatile CBS 122367]|uniref:ASTRA-associated protein 1 n=1 Tax=Lentithecium fluviatile CBS 122367 TaxID=1168545 RepID=A0A6G1JDC7_9PLEO|nr:WD40 repeat-like protein [Lentithecium fluviatile CBS 122367]
MTADTERQSSTRGPAQPSYIFRGHTAQIHSAQIVRRNTCLVTGDADGWVVYWELGSKRPFAVWQAHTGAILGTAEWGPGKLITHGRDHTLRIWEFGATDASTLSTVLPADGSYMHRAKPWLLHSIPVNTLNFCAFSMCYEEHALGLRSSGPASKTEHAPPASSSEPILIAVPARDDKKIEIYQFPDEKLVAFVPRVEPTDTGMVMAVKLMLHQPSRRTLVVAGYEGGFTAAYLLPRNPTTDFEATRKSAPIEAQIFYLSQSHTQPILSLDAAPDGTTYFTSSADAVIAAHRIPEFPFQDDMKRVATPTAEDPIAASEQASDSKPGPPNVPEQTLPQSVETPQKQVESSTNLSPLPSQSSIPTPSPKQASAAKPSGLSLLLSSASLPKVKPPEPPALTTRTAQDPYKSVNTKHAGQQSLRVRSDGRLLVTGGWDSRVRIYSTRTLKEVAVLKWHKEGVYAAEFSKILEVEDVIAQGDEDSNADGVKDTTVVKRETGLSRLRRQREEQVQLKHWVVAGAKDGKVSLWEVF